MKKYIFSFVAILTLLVVTACGSNKLKGTWEGATTDGIKTTITFDKKDKVTYKNEYGFKLLSKSISEYFTFIYESSSSILIVKLYL